MSDIQIRQLFYNKNNKIVMKFNNNVFVKIIKKQASKVAYKINTYFIKNNIIITKFYIAYIFLNKNIVIQTINKEKTKKLRRKNS